jgi:hypothetical protein
MKTQTAVPEDLDYPTSSVNTIDIRIDKKEYEILTEDCTCIIDEVEFVKIIDIETNMPLPVVAAPQPTTTATPRKGMSNFLSHLLNRLSILPLTLPLCLVLVLGVGNVWGQINITAGGSAVTQNFNSLGTSSTATLPTDWTVQKSTTERTIPNFLSTATAVERAGGNSISSTAANGIYRFNANNSTSESAIGGLSSSSQSKSVVLYTRLNNNAAAAISSFTISYNVEKYRNGSNAAGYTIEMFYSTNGTSWTSCGSDFTTNFASDADNNGFVTSPGSSVAISNKTFTPASSISQNTVFYFAWRYSVTSGTTTSNAQVLGVDDISITANAAATAPTLTSPTVSSITSTSATLGATVSSNGGAVLSARGTVWGTSASPTGNSLAESGTTVSAFTHSRTGLTANTEYTYRGYATNSAGTGYSADGTFTTLPLEPTVGAGNSITASGFTANWSHPTMGAATYTYTVEVDDDIAFGSINSTVSSIASSNTSQAITGLAASTNYYYRVKAVNVQGSSDWSSTSAGIATSAAATPTLNPVTLASALSSTYGTASTGVSFTANGSNLTGNIAATAQSGYEVSTSLGSGYDASVSVSAGTTVYVRFASTISVGNKDNATAVVLSGGGASSSANVTTSSSGNTVSKATPTINSSPTATAVTYGQTLASSTLSGGSASVAGSFAFTTPSNAPNGGTANQSVTFTPTDNANYNTTTTNVSVTVNQATQTITFGALANKTTADAAFSLTATASSGLTVTYSSSNTAVATIVGSTVTIQGSGQTTITASQAGDGNYNAATSVDQTLTVTQAPVTIFTENIGSPSGTTSITSHTFQNSSTLTFSNGGATNSADIRTTSTSSGYTGASGNGNVFFTGTSGSYGFAIEGIDVSTYTNLEVRFAYRKENATVLPDLTLDYWNGSSYVNVPFSFNEAANASVAWYMVNWISLPASAQISTLRLRWVKAGSQSVRLDDISLRGIINTSPLILISQNTMSDFSQNSSTPSAEQSYTVSGDNLTTDVTITPPTGFEISTATGGSFSATNPITLTASDGDLVGEPVTIYVKQSSSTLGVVSGNITHSSTGSNNPNVAVSGTRTGSYYSKSSGNLEELGTWGINTDGSGSTPSNFSTNGIIYEIRNRATATIGANWTVSGAASKVLVGDGTNSTDFTIPSTFTLTGTIDVSNAGELTIENTTAPTIGTVADNGTVEYKNVAFTLSAAATYKNLKLSGSGTKTFPGNTTTITGNLILDNVTLDAPSSSPFSTILLGGNLTYIGTVTPPADANSITLSTNGTTGGTQTISGAGNTLRWFRIQSTTANTILLSTSGGSSNLLVGNISGGGVTLVDGSVLNMNGNDLTLFNSSSTSSAFLFNNTASISTNSSSDFTIGRTGNGNLGTIRFTTGTSTIGSLTLNHTGSTNKTLNIENQLTIANSLALTSGILNVGESTLTLNGSINRTSGNIDASNASATVVFGGSTAQTIPAATFTGNINNLTLNNSAGLSINQDISVVNTLTLTSGKLTLGSNHLTLGLNATIGGTPSASNMIIASGDGELRKRFSAANLDAFTFPVGTGTSYTPVVLDFNSGTFGADAYMRVRVKNEKSSFLNSNISTYLNRNWIVEPFDITSPNYSIQLYFNPAATTSGGDFFTSSSMTIGDLKPVKYSDGTWYQPNDGPFTNATPQGTAGVVVSDHLVWNNLMSFSEFGGAGGSNQPLPVELLSFNASCVEDQNILSWQTASEYNSSHFDIERSRDGQTWNVIGQQTAAGNSTELLSYQFVDSEKNNSTVYYRLNQVDVDGKNEYFGPITLACEQNSFEASTLPNPSAEDFWLRIQTENNESVSLQIKDINGAVIHGEELTIIKGINMFPIRKHLTPGIYLIDVKTNKGNHNVIKHLRY